LKVLIVEDDLRIAKPITEDLEHQQLIVDHAVDGEEAWQLCMANEYDLVLLDVMLPKLNGIELCRRLRQNGYSKSILIITARGDKNEKILGLDSGADDYVVKPFDLDELGARVRALIRRNSDHRQSILQWGELIVDVRRCFVSYREQQVELTPTEYRLLVHFLRHPDKAFSQHELIEKLWSFDMTPTDSVIKAHIKGLRKKLRSIGCTNDVIETVYGMGYRLRPHAD